MAEHGTGSRAGELLRRSARLLERTEDRTSSPRAAGATCDDPLQFRGDALQFIDAIDDVGKVFACKGVDLAAGKRGVVVQAQQASYFVETESEFTSSRDETKPPDLAGTERAVAAARARRSRH